MRGKQAVLYQVNYVTVLLCKKQNYKKRKMSWNVFLSLLMCFTQNEKIAPIIDSIGAFPDELRDILNVNNRK